MVVSAVTGRVGSLISFVLQFTSLNPLSQAPTKGGAEYTGHTNLFLQFGGAIMLKTIWNNHRELYVLIGGLAAVLIGTSIEFFSAEDTYTFAHEIGYVIWCAAYIYWIISITRKFRETREHPDERALFDIQQYRIADNLHSMKYFVVDESDHTTVNLWRKLRGKVTVRLFKGEAFEGGIFSQSCTTYVVTKKQLFEMRLRGYGPGCPVEMAKKALKDEWMRKFRSWTN